MLPSLGGGKIGDDDRKEEGYYELMEAIRTLAPQLHAREVDREIISALWGICYLAWLWGLEPDGMLQRNGLIAPEDIERLSRWLEALGYAVMRLLEGGDVESRLLAVV